MNCKDMNYEDMTKEELIAYIKEMKSKRAFEYEDQMKLEILDNSPFTVWASDRNCIIKLWMGQCESLYGFSSEEALNKDYVDLFVANDEKVAARRDQIEIIDNGKIFHNIANDIGKNGNTLQLITNCRRIKDIKSGEYWNAEIGVIIDYLEEEKIQLKSRINESQKIKSYGAQFAEEISQAKERFSNRKTSILSAIKNCERSATILRKRHECRTKMYDIHLRLDELSKNMNNTCDSYILKMDSCKSLNSCKETRQSFFKEQDIISDALEDYALDVFDISCDYSVEQNLVSDKDAFIKDMSYQYRTLSELAHSILRTVEKEKNDYKALVTSKPNCENGRYKLFLDIEQQVITLKSQAEKYEDEFSFQVLKAISKHELEAARTHAEDVVKQINLNMTEVKEKLKSVAEV